MKSGSRKTHRGDTLIVESYGEEQVVIMDVLDYRLMRAVAAHHRLPPHASPVNDPDLEPAGLSEAELAADKPLSGEADPGLAMAQT